MTRYEFEDVRARARSAYLKDGGTLKRLMAMDDHGRALVQSLGFAGPDAVRASLDRFAKRRADARGVPKGRPCAQTDRRTTNSGDGPERRATPQTDRAQTGTSGDGGERPALI